MHPPDQRDARFLFPYPAAHSMRLQVPCISVTLISAAIQCSVWQGGMWDYRSTRKPPPPQSESGGKTGQAKSGSEEEPSEGIGRPDSVAARKRGRDDADTGPEESMTLLDGPAGERVEKRIKVGAAGTGLNR